MLPMIIRTVVFPVLALLSYMVPATAANPESKSLKIGMIQTMFRDVQPTLVKAMSLPLRTMIEARTGLSGDVEIVKDADSLAEQMKKEELGLGVFHGFEYAWLREANPNIIPLVVTQPGAGKMQAIIVVNKICQASSITDLEPEDVIIPSGSKAHCILFAQRSTNKLNSEEIKIAPETQNAVLTDVALGKCTAAVVDISALNAYKLLQPGAYKQLRFLSSSVDFPATVITYNKGSISEQTAEQIRTMLTSCHKTSSGKPLLMLWNLQSFQAVPEDYTKQLEAIRETYPAPESTIKK